jgi:hypothetical protein
MRLLKTTDMQGAMMRLEFRGATALYVFGTKGVYYGNYTGA